MKYRVGDVVLLTPVTITKVDENDDDLPYCVKTEDGRRAWMPEKQIMALLYRLEPEIELTQSARPGLKLKVGDIAWHKNNNALYEVIGLNDDRLYPYRAKVIKSNIRRMIGCELDSSDAYLEKIELPK